MRSLCLPALLVLWVVPFTAPATAQPAAPPAAQQRRQQEASQSQEKIVSKAGKLVDGRAGRVLSNQSILIQGDRIVQVGPDIAAPARARTIDLSDATVLPGLIDNHTHILLQAHPTPSDYDEQLIKESIAYRAIRATVSAQIALNNGFTAIRDLETEGAMYADVDVKTDRKSTRLN